MLRPYICYNFFPNGKDEFARNISEAPTDNNGALTSISAVFCTLTFLPT